MTLSEFSIMHAYHLMTVKEQFHLKIYECTTICPYF